MTIEKPVDEQAVIDYYFYPHTLKNTLAYFHIGELRLRKIVEKHGLKMRTCGQLNKKYSYDKDFFIKQSSNLAYFLGLMGSDGCIATNSNHIYIELQDSDSEILQDIAHAMNLTRPIKHYTTKRGYKNAKLYIEDKWLKDILVNNWGLCSNKTYDLDNFTFPYNLEEQYWKDYIRGYFDGDGCIKDTGRTITFQIDGSNFNLLNYIKNYLESKLNIKVNILTRKPDGYNHIIPLYRLYCYGENARTVFKFIYQNPMDLFLNRKYNKYLLMTQEKGK